MINKLLVPTMIAALLWAGFGYVTPTPTELGGNTEETSALVQTIDVPAEITSAEAENIALTHAGLTAGQVTRLHAEPDFDDGRKEYEVEFRCGDWEYDYTVLAATGEILKHSKEYDPPNQKVTEAPAETTPPETKPVETVPAETKPAEATPVETKAAQAKTLTAAEAKAIALTHAGFTADQVKGLRAEFDRDDRVPEYEVEFYVNGWEYDYEIHAESGKILNWDKDRDD